MGLFLGSSSSTNEAPSGIRRSGIIFDPVDWSIDRYYMDTKNRNYPGKTEIQKVVVAFIPGGRVTFYTEVVGFQLFVLRMFLPVVVQTTGAVCDVSVINSYWSNIEI